MTDARTASVGENETAHLDKGIGKEEDDCGVEKLDRLFEFRTIGSENTSLIICVMYNELSNSRLTLKKVSEYPSLSMVARICSLPEKNIIKFLYILSLRAEEGNGSSNQRVILQ